MENESKQLLFFKNRIKSKIESLKPYISNQKYKLYCVMLDECQSLEEIKAMAEIDFQFELAKYIRNLELRLSGMDTTLEELKMADKTLINSSKGVIIKPAKRSKPLITEEELDDMLNNDLVMTAAANSLAMRLAMTPKEELQQTNELTEEEEALEELDNINLDEEDSDYEEDLGDIDEDEELDAILDEDDSDYEDDLGDIEEYEETEQEPLKDDEIDFGTDSSEHNIWESSAQRLADEEGVDLEHLDDLFDDSEEDEDSYEEDDIDGDDLDSLFEDDEDNEDSEEDSYDQDDYDYDSEDESLEDEIDSIFEEEEDDDEDSEESEDEYDIDSLFDDEDEESEEDNFDPDEENMEDEIDNIFDDDSDNDYDTDDIGEDDYDTAEEGVDPNDLDSLFSDDDEDTVEDDYEPEDEENESEDDETDINKLLSALDDEDDETNSDDEPAEPEDSSSGEDDEDSIDKLLAELDMNLSSSNKMSANKNNDIQEYLDKQNNNKHPRSREVDKIFVNGTERGQKTQTMYNGIAKLLNLSGRQGRKIKGKAKKVVNSSFFQL